MLGHELTDECMDAMIERMDAIDDDFFEILELMHACNDQRIDAMMDFYLQYRNVWRALRIYGTINRMP